MTRCKHFERRKQQYMSYRKRWQLWLGLTLVVLLVAGCSGAQATTYSHNKRSEETMTSRVSFARPITRAKH